MYSVGVLAHNPELNLSLVDAIAVQSRMREVIQPELGEWLEVEAEPIATELHPPDVRWVGWVFIVSGGMWLALGCLVVRAFNR